MRIIWMNEKITPRSMYKYLTIKLGYSCLRVEKITSKPFDSRFSKMQEMRMSVHTACVDGPRLLHIHTK